MHVTEGLGLAINAGDLALALVCGTVVDDPGLDDRTKLRVLSELVSMTTRTIEGQALDIGWARDDRFDLTTDDYLLMANHKTAYYSGAVPLAIGAIIGEGTETQIATLRAFGMASGLAFQIQDDVLNLVGTKESTKKDFRSDIAEGKRTLVAVHALQHSPERERLLEILSARTSEIVATRARELGIARVLQGRSDKGLAWQQLLADTGVPAEQASFIGDDLPDLPVLKRAGLAATVADARDEVKAASHWITPQPGGRGAVRALAEFILRAKGVAFAEMTHG